MALNSLLETCDAHRHVFRVPDFGGLEVVFREDPSELHRGEPKRLVIVGPRVSAETTPMRRFSSEAAFLRFVAKRARIARTVVFLSILKQVQNNTPGNKGV